MARTGKKRAEKAQGPIDEQELQSRAQAVHYRLLQMNCGTATFGEARRILKMPYKRHGSAVPVYDLDDLIWMEGLEKRVLMGLLPTE